VNVGSTNTSSTTNINGGNGITLATNAFGAGTTVRSSVNSATAFQVQNAASNAILTADSTTGTLTITQGGLRVMGLANPTNVTLTTSSTGGSLPAGAYTYRVSANGTNGETQAIAASPYTATTTGSTSRNTITWDTVAYASNYRVYRSTDGGTTWFVNTIAAGTTTMIDNGSTYTWATSGSAIEMFNNNTANIQIQDAALMRFGNSGANIRYDAEAQALVTFVPGTAMVQGNAFVFQDTTGYNSNLVIQNTGAARFRNRVNTANAFEVQNTSNQTILTADTLANQVLLGQASAISGKLVVASSGGGGVTLSVGSTAANYTLNLPTAAPTAGGQCLQTAGGSTTNLTFGSCGTGGGGATSYVKKVSMVPEYTGAVFSPSGSNNTGYMSTGLATGLSSGQGYKHNYYAWTTDQATAQSYDIIMQYQLPSDFSSFVSSSWKIWTYAHSLSSTSITWNIKSANETVCYGSSQSALPGAANTWTQITLANPGNGCTFAAGDVITISVTPSSVTPSTNQVRVGEFEYQYNSAY
jgi:hypothetical protein